MERFVYCNEVKQVVVQRASLKKIKTSQVFSYIVSPHRVPLSRREPIYGTG